MPASLRKDKYESDVILYWVKEKVTAETEHESAHSFTDKHSQSSTGQIDDPDDFTPFGDSDSEADSDDDSASASDDDHDNGGRSKRGKGKGKSKVSREHQLQRERATEARSLHAYCMS